MSKWSFEVRSGCLEALPNSMVQIVEEQKIKEAQYFLHAETGVLLNEPEDQITASIPANAPPSLAVARIAHVFSWFFGLLETEIDQNLRWNYFKFTFVNLKPLGLTDTSTGIMSTNEPGLPPPVEQPPHLMIHQMVTTMRMFFSHMRGSVEIADWESDLYSCDWVSMTYSKAF
jgi:hypothetical protein